MCVMSMVMDHYTERWWPMVPVQPFTPQPVTIGGATTIVMPTPISADEVAEFRRLLDRAREYDKRHNEPDCELESKRQVLKKLAEQLGIDISFIDPPAQSSERTTDALAR